MIHERHDTLFGGRLPSPSLQTLGALSNFVVENHCNLGIATDGDADRIGIIDETGTFLHPNKILVLLYYYLVSYRGWKGAAVAPTIRPRTCWTAWRRASASNATKSPWASNTSPQRCRRRTPSSAAESSGGLTVRGHIPGKDGIYAAALLVEMVARTGKTLSAIYRDIENRFGTLYITDADFTMTGARKRQLMHMLFSDKALPLFPFDIDRVSYMDGCKVYFKNGGWVICRFSGTEPLPAHVRRNAGGGGRCAMPRYLEGFFKTVTVIDMKPTIKNKPYFDPDFLPVAAVKRAYEKKCIHSALHRGGAGGRSLRDGG